MLRPLRSDAPFELDTFWWRLGSDGQPVTNGDATQAHGILRYSPERGVEVTVFDLFPDIDPFHVPHRLPVLLGETLEHQPCVLFDAVLASTDGNLFGGHHRLLLRGHQFLVGEHLAGFGGMSSKCFRARLRGLREWLMAPHRIDPEQVRAGLSRQTHPEGMSLKLDGARLLLGFDCYERGGQAVDEVATATFEFDEEVQLERFLADWLVPLQDFLVLANREQSVLESLVVERHDEHRWERIHPVIRHGSRPETFNHWNVQVVRTPHVPLARRRHNQFKMILLPLAALADDVEGGVRRWYQLRWRLREPAAYFFTALNQDLPPLSRHFLDCMSFAETYHRVNSAHWARPSRTPLPKDEHRRLRDSMLERLGDHRERERYKRALDSANQPDNSERIAQLFARAREVDFAVDLQEATLPGALVATRNYLTHWSDKRKAVLEAVGRFQAVRRLTLVLQVNLLLDLDLRPETIKACVDGSYASAIWDDRK